MFESLGFKHLFSSTLSCVQPAADFPIVQPAADFPIFTHVVTSQAQVVVYSPQFSTGSAQARFDGSAHIIRALSFEPCPAPSNSAQCMSVAMAYLSPAIDFTISMHCNAIIANTTKAGVPGFVT